MAYGVEDGGEPFSLGRVFSNAIAPMASNPLPLFGIGLLAAIPAVLVTVYGLSNAVGPDPESITDPLAAMKIGGAVLVGLILQMIFSAFAQAANIHTALAAIRGEETDFGEAAAFGLRLMLPMIGLNILWSLGVGLAAVLLIIPMFFVLTMWAATTGALVNENTGVFGAFSRSNELTEGLRTQVFLSLFVFIIAYAGLSFVLQGFSFQGLEDTAKTNTVAAVLIGILTSGILPVFLNTFLASLYAELVYVKEGGDSQGLAQIFS